MALHRDIFWVGRQWAVTGFGLQAVDQRLRGAIDIPVARLWDDDLIGRRREMPGIRLEDFDKALAIGRARFPPLQDSVAVSPPPFNATPAPPEPPAPPAAPEAAVMPARPPPLTLSTAGSLARFVPQWRVRQ